LQAAPAGIAVLHLHEIFRAETPRPDLALVVPLLQDRLERHQPTIASCHSWRFPWIVRSSSTYCFAASASSSRCLWLLIRSATACAISSGPPARSAVSPCFQVRL